MSGALFLPPLTPDRAPLLGGWLFAPAPALAETLARQGYDFAVLDLQHGLMGLETMATMIQALLLGGASPVVRIPVNEPGVIGRALDAGAAGVIVPMIETVADAARAVVATRYPPAGQRSFGPFLAAQRYGPDYARDANSGIRLLAMIETAAALEAVEAIAALDGVDALFVGPFDLSLALGLPPGDNDGDPRFDAALARVVGVAKAAGKAAGVLTTPRLAARRIAQGFRFLSIIADLPAFAELSAQALSAARAAQGDTPC